MWNQLCASGRTPPNVRTFTELIGACCKALETEKAFQLLVQMRQQLGQEPNSSTYAALLESCARAGRVEANVLPVPMRDGERRVSAATVG